MFSSYKALVAGIFCGLSMAASTASKDQPRAQSAGSQQSIESYRLANGMRIILAPDASVPVATVSMLFDVGGRQEPKGRSGFAHLFEHLMFEGSANAPKGVFDRLLESYGGDNNAQTHKDFTIYYETLPSNAIPLALWLDADRINSLSITKDALANQIAVVKEEKRLSIDNAPYGPLLYDAVSQHSFKNWHNAHSIMGSFEDLEAASLSDVKNFFNAYYAPSNAMMALVGNFKPAQAKRWIERYFAWIPNRGQPSPIDTTEPPASAFTEVELPDHHAKLPAVVITWKEMPERGAWPDYHALTLLGNALFQGKSSRLYQKLVKEKRWTIEVNGGLGFPEGDFSESKSPLLFGCFVIYKNTSSPKNIQDLIVEEIASIASSGISSDELARIQTKFRSDWIRSQETTLGRAQAILKMTLFEGDPEKINSELSRYEAVTSQNIQAAAAKYLSRMETMTRINAIPAPSHP